MLRGYRGRMAEPHRLDLSATAAAVASLIANVPGNALNVATPCPDYSLGDLIDHVGGLAIAFTAAARKESLGTGAQPGDAARLVDAWRTEIPARLHTLAEAWNVPDAWEGMTVAGGIDLPGRIAGVIAADELVLHGWDIARASDQAYDVAPEVLEACRRLLDASADGRRATGGNGAFGAPVAVAAGASALEAVVALSGRDPAWSATHP